MRASIITATLLSISALSGARIVHAEPVRHIVFDSISAGSPGSIDMLCSRTSQVVYQGLDANGDPQQITGEGPFQGWGILVHTQQSMRITGVAASFVEVEGAGDSVASGDGVFAIFDMTAGKQLASIIAPWDLTNTLPAVAVDLAWQLEAGKDYVISYVWEAPDGATPCFKFAGQEDPSSVYLTSLGYKKMEIDPGASTAVHQEAWLPETGTHDGPVPGFAIEAVTDDTDTDGDGKFDGVDNCIDDPNPNQDDFDYDGIGDACDNCPYSYNPDQSSCSNGGGGGTTNPDADGDGIFDVRDNCPIVANAGQGDGDHDGTGDACDGPAEDTGCNVGGGSPSLLFGLGMLFARRRKSARTSR